MYQNGRVGAIIVAAGNSQRMGGIDKLFEDVGGSPVLSHSLGVFQRSQQVDSIALVLSKRNLLKGRELAFDSYPKVFEVCLGGMRRQDSVREGLKRLADCRWVIVHDGARPFVTEDLVKRGLETAQESGAAIAAVPVKDTIKVVDGENLIVDTPRRERLWAAQTPQIFRYDILTEAYKKAKGDVTDDATLVERLGVKVKVYLGSYDNIKITTGEDLIVAGNIDSRRRYADRHRL